MESKQTSSDIEQNRKGMSISLEKMKSSLSETKNAKQSESKSNGTRNISNQTKVDKDINSIRGFPIHCTLCQITQPFIYFTDVVSHFYGQRHRRVGYKMLYLDSKSSITFKGTLQMANAQIFY